MNPRPCHCLAGLALMLMLGACALPGQNREPVATYLLEWPEEAPPAADLTGVPCRTAAVRPPRSAPGYGTERIAYRESDYRLDYFAYHRWANPPASLLHPLMVRALERSGLFRAVASNPGPAALDVQIDTELLRLQQEFREGRSQVRMQVRVDVFDRAGGRLLASRFFNATEASPANPVGGVAAANRAVAQYLAELTRFLDEALPHEYLTCGEHEHPGRQ